MSLLSRHWDEATGYMPDSAGCISAVKNEATGQYYAQNIGYDAFGDLAAEYAVSTGTQAGCGTPTCYVSVDQIGSTRLVTDANGNSVRRYDYTPFGEELWAGTGGRTMAMGYQSAPDGFNPKFTGQQRDTESFLDYFRARYYSPQQGRFVSADPQNAGADPANPQTWNGYAYVGNNPLNITDPTGESWVTAMFGAMGFIGGTLSGGALAPVWWYTAIMTGATTAGAQYSFEKAVNSGNIAAIAGVFLGGPNQLPDYGSGFIIFDWQNWKNGRVELPNGDAAIYGHLGRGAPILKGAGERAAHDIGCVVPGFGASAAGGGLFVTGQETPLAFRSPVTGKIVGFSPAKPHALPGATLSSSNFAEWARGAAWGAQKFKDGPRSAPVGNPFRPSNWTPTPTRGGWAGRIAPVAGGALTVRGAVGVYSCLSR